MRRRAPAPSCAPSPRRRWPDAMPQGAQCFCTAYARAPHNGMGCSAPAGGWRRGALGNKVPPAVECAQGLLLSLPTSGRKRYSGLLRARRKLISPLLQLSHVTIGGLQPRPFEVEVASAAVTPEEAVHLRLGPRRVPPGSGPGLDFL
jgi:hypothetical protein